MIIAAIILFAIALTVWVVIDYQKFLAGTIINHTREAAFKIAFLIPSGVCFTNFESWWRFPLSLFMMLSVWWFVFDGIFNTLRNDSWFHVGGSAKMDIMQQSWSVPVRAMVKIGLIALSVFLYIWFR